MYDIFLVWNTHSRACPKATSKQENSIDHAIFLTIRTIDT